MREKYESLSAVVLRDLAKARGLKNISGMKKSDLVDLMVAEDERQGREENTKQREQTPQREQAQREQISQREQAQQRPAREPRETREGKGESTAADETISNLDSGIMANGILEVMPDGYGFIRCENYLPGENDVYVSPSQIRKFNLKTGDIVAGNTRVKTQQEKFSALLYVSSVNGYHPSVAQKRKNFEDLTPIFPNRRIRLERPGCSVAMRIVDLVSPIGKGQRGMIVSQPKAGKTTLLKEIAKSVTKGNPDMHLIILLIDERPEEVTDIKEAIVGENVEVIYSTFDELPEHHKRVSEMVTASRDWQEPTTLRFRQADVRYPEVLTRQRCTCRSAFSVRPETCVREEVSQSLPLRWWIPEARWMTWCSRSLREPATWSWCLTASFPRSVCSLPSTL